MTRSATHKLHAYLALVTSLLVAAWAVRLPELAIVAAPFAALLVLGLARLQPPAQVEARVELPRARALQGEELALRLEVCADRDLATLQVLLSAPGGMRLANASYRIDDLRGGEHRRLEVPVSLEKWGVFTAVAAELRAPTALGLFEEHARLDWGFTLRVYPSPQTLRSIIAPRETQPSAGNLVGRGAGSGIEFSEVRPFAAGDERRHVNWRATARRNELWVNARRPERNADLVLFLDAFTHLATPAQSALDLMVGAAAALARRSLRDRDKVGVISFGGALSWLRPGTGERQLYQISEALIAARVSFSYAWKDVAGIPARVLPPQATVIALSPLVDERYERAVFDLLRRRFDVCVLEMPPEIFLPAPDGERAQMARRIWRLQREALLDRYRALGASVVSLDGRRPLDAVLQDTLGFRRQARVVASR